MARYYGTDTGVVVVDDFLTPNALEEMRAVCEESVVWHDDGTDGDVGRSYLGAYIRRGLAPALLLQV